MINANNEYSHVYPELTKDIRMTISQFIYFLQLDSPIDVATALSIPQSIYQHRIEPDHFVAFVKVKPKLLNSQF